MENNLMDFHLDQKVSSLVVHNALNKNYYFDFDSLHFDLREQILIGDYHRYHL